MTRPRSYLVALLAAAAGLLAASPARAGSWQNNFAFGATLQGDLYTPTTPAASPAILVVIHMCTGHSTTVHGWFDSYADQNGFYLIAPDAGKQCFDASAARSGDKAAIVTMVNYLVTNKHADKTRVFATGMSSGGCMTNTLLAVYPDVFAGGSAMPGFPAGGWPAGDTTCTKCGSQPPNMSAAQWAAVATNVFKWSGQYGCSQQWVGGGDQYNFNGWLPSVVLQWQGLAGLGAATSEASWSDHSGWTRTVYKDSAGNVRLETNLGPSSQKHDLETVSPTLYKDVISFLGLDKPTGACGLDTTSTTGGGGSNGTGGASGTGGTTGTGGATGTGGST
ncbi:MAG TPA: PHB depolymerase family esterase, partial [Polyangia bacterium]|nr:PHB depolymerase family esterase [Polyangia bacterium]